MRKGGYGKRYKGVKVQEEEQMIREQRIILRGELKRNRRKTAEESKKGENRREMGKDRRRAGNSPEVCLCLLRGSQIREMSDLVVICQPL